MIPQTIATAAARVAPAAAVPPRVVARAGAYVTAIAAAKGGSGKTTLAASLAVARALYGLRSVPLVDADGNRSASALLEVRQDALSCGSVHPYQARGRGVRETVRNLKLLYDELFVDLPAGITAEFGYALECADRVLIPVRPSHMDVWTVEDMEDALAAARSRNPDIEACAVLVDVEPHAGRLVAQAEARLREANGITLIEGVRISHRAAYRRMGEIGRTVIEGPRIDRKAAAELTALVDALYVRDSA